MKRMLKAGAVSGFTLCLIVAFQNFSSFGYVNPVGSRIEQFGFWGSALDFIGIKNDYSAEVKNLSDVVHVNSFSSSVDEIAKKLMNASANGQRAVLHVDHLFFKGFAKGRTLKLYEDAENRFFKIWSELGRRGLSNIVVGFYVYDEPYGVNFLLGLPDEKGGDQLSRAEQIHASYVRDNLNFAGAILKKYAPQLPSIVIFGHIEITFKDLYSSLWPEQITWLGFDCYESGEDLNFVPAGTCSEQNVRKYFQQFSNKLTASQSLVLIPDAYLPFEYQKSPPGAQFTRACLNPAFQPRQMTLARQAKLIRRLRLYKELAASSTRVVAVYPWLYQTYVSEFGCPLYLGVDQLPDLKSELIIYFQTLRGKGRCIGTDWVSTSNSASRWPNAPVCGPVCEDGRLVYRDADGTFLRDGGQCN